MPPKRTLRKSKKRSVATPPRIELTRLAVHRGTEHWLVALRIPTGHGLGRERFFPLEEVVEFRTCKRLFSRYGFCEPLSKAAHDELLAGVQSAQRAGTRCYLTEHLGWHEDVFVRPFESIGPSSSPSFVYQGGFLEGELPRGSLENWKTQVAGPAQTSSLAVFLICVALAPVLFRFVKGQSRDLSAIFHISGPSSTGKSTLALVAASIWRGGASALDTWNTTAAGLEDLWARRNDSLACLDEIVLAAADPTALRLLLRQITYGLTQSTGRRRHKSFEGGAPPVSYRLLAISTGEVSAAEIARYAGEKRMKGEEVRFIDLSFAAGETGVIDRLTQYRSGDANQTSGEVVRALNEAVNECYGTAGPEFVRYVVDYLNLAEDLELFQSKVDSYIQSFLLKDEVLGNQWEERLARKFALVYAAGMLAIQARVLPWSTTLLHRVIPEIYSSARAALKAEGDRVAEVLGRLKGCLQGDHFVDLVMAKDPPSREVMKAAHAHKRKLNGQIVFSIPTVVFEALGDSHSCELLLAQLEKDGILIRPAGRSPRRVKQFTLWEGQKPRTFCYIFTADLVAYEPHSTQGKWD